ncbi:uncharacterized protein A1O5_12665 [Cladophialophora psammophila CBS 110553]|uniref:Uncharacterized protein n=1 Tax=Cladophialophora psammophila CBS 110553 TaxID=1182543 RepID=W9WCG3_9EURO|nr:uncharacterized protein A1O5_12665 [Cladophialophora psammophila CBS 110553]EXJ56209.1 hypothetical protein A1O5_12665 [Cladophialophora psammophila CBS 110553]
MTSLSSLISEEDEYTDENFEHLTQKETKMVPNPQYMTLQPKLNWGMRTTVVEWLIVVWNYLNFNHQVLYLTVNIMDRFLSLEQVEPNQLPLIATASLVLAVKYEHHYPHHSTRQIIEIINLEPTPAVLRAESYIFRRLGYDLNWPGPSIFLHRINKINIEDTNLIVLGHYLLEITLRDERFVSSLPSFTATVAYCLAREMLGEWLWTPQHVQSSGYTGAELEPFVQILRETCQSPYSETVKRFSQRHAVLYAKVEKRLQWLKEFNSEEGEL